MVDGGFGEGVCALKKNCSHFSYYDIMTVVIGKASKKIIELIGEVPIVLITQALVLILDLLDIVLRPFVKGTTDQTKVVIEAGSRGWDSNFFCELLISAGEFFGSENVIRLTILPNEDRLKQLKHSIIGNKVRFLIYDPRTNNRDSIYDLYDALLVSIYCRLRGIRVIAYLTDPSITLWRLQSIIASRANGSIVTPMSNEKLGWLVWRIKISGPLPMPISIRTSMFMRGRLLESTRNFDGIESLTFRGSLYRPRLTFFANLNTILEQKGSPLRLIANSKDESLISTADYWNALIDNAVCITTTFQVVPQGIRADRPWINQMVFRISEALAAGNLLFSSPCPGLEELFERGKHYVEYKDEEDLANQIIFYASNTIEATKIRLEGNAQMFNLISQQFFWREVIKSMY
jgi:glycosyltransferase involved in cell wall biosynthesis